MTKFTETMSLLLVVAIVTSLSTPTTAQIPDLGLSINCTGVLGPALLLSSACSELSALVFAGGDINFADLELSSLCNCFRPLLPEFAPEGKCGPDLGAIANLTGGIDLGLCSTENIACVDVLSSYTPCLTDLGISLPTPDPNNPGAAVLSLEEIAAQCTCLGPVLDSAQPDGACSSLSLLDTPIFANGFGDYDQAALEGICTSGQCSNYTQILASCSSSSTDVAICQCLVDAQIPHVADLDCDFGYLPSEFPWDLFTTFEEPSGGGCSRLSACETEKANADACVTASTVGTNATCVNCVQALVDSYQKGGSCYWPEVNQPADQVQRLYPECESSVSNTEPVAVESQSSSASLLSGSAILAITLLLALLSF